MMEIRFDKNYQSSSLHFWPHLFDDNQYFWSLDCHKITPSLNFKCLTCKSRLFILYINPLIYTEWGFD